MYFVIFQNFLFYVLFFIFFNVYFRHMHLSYISKVQDHID